ncbi:MAG TPA: monofunctional biosynthetic peptidoglycan transglycosylase [Bryobacteraceae bacterium]|nr:monofunctional biosynthetic peptidoglycan transglycosylase [Bryobacteraceae bacterium]
MPATSPKRKRRLLRRILTWFLLLAAAFYTLAALGFLALRWIDPPFTMVHVQRRIESWFHRGPYRKHYEFVPLDSISPAFQHAVIAAEDARFFHHHGFDWHEVHEAVEDGLDDGKLRGASTIDEQLAKNLFLTTNRSLLRKGLEVTLVPLEELILSKRRILELYLNVVEWGPAVYGAEAAARYHYGVPASRIGREQGARLAAILPSPRRRQPARMNRYAARILIRMEQMGW